MNPTHRSVLALITLVALSALLVAAPARAADEEQDPAAALLDQLETLRKANDTAGLASAIAKVPDVYKKTEDKSLKGKFFGALGKIAKDKGMGDARVAAVDTLVALGDPKEAWRELSRQLPDVKTEEPTPFDKAVVKAAGTLAQRTALKPLFDLAEKAKSNDLAAVAVAALGEFKHEEKRYRVKILADLIDFGRRARPGRTTSTNPSPEAVARWQALAPPLVGALNALTGKTVTSFDDWEALYKDHKKRPLDLFEDDGK